MNVWIVEDENTAAADAFEAVKRLDPLQEMEAFRDSDMIWGADLRPMPENAADLPVSPLDHMPDIVILDLLDKNLQFAAGKYYSKLRQEEVEHGLPSSFVIAWSVKNRITGGE